MPIYILLLFYLKDQGEQTLGLQLPPPNLPAKPYALHPDSPDSSCDCLPVHQFGGMRMCLHLWDLMMALGGAKHVLPNHYVIRLVPAMSGNYVTRPLTL